MGWPHHALFYATIGVFVLLCLPQLIVDSLQLKVRVPLGGRQVLMYGIVAMMPYYVGFLGFIYLAARTALQGAASTWRSPRSCAAWRSWPRGWRGWGCR